MIRHFFRWLWAQWVMDELPAWRDPLPDLPVLDLEQVDHELGEQMRLPRYERDFGLVTFLLDMRGPLGATPADGELLRAGRAS